MLKFIELLKIIQMPWQKRENTQETLNKNQIIQQQFLPLVAPASSQDQLSVSENMLIH